MKLALFDLDDTLIGTKDIYKIGAVSIIEKQLSISVKSEDYLELWGKPIIEWFVYFTKKNNSDLNNINHMVKKFNQWYFNNHSDYVTYFDGVDLLLQTLKSQGFTIGIVTSRDQKRAELAYDLRFGNFIDFIVGSDQVENPKPYPDAIDYAIKLTNSELSMVFFVGDNASDIKSANSSKHNVLSIGVLWASEKPELLLLEKPDFSFNTINDFQNFCEKVFYRDKGL